MFFLPDSSSLSNVYIRRRWDLYTFIGFHQGLHMLTLTCQTVLKLKALSIDRTRLNRLYISAGQCVSPFTSDSGWRPTYRPVEVKKHRQLRHRSWLFAHHKSLDVLICTTQHFNTYCNISRQHGSLSQHPG